MRLSLKAGERIFINGAVLRVERRVVLELLNDATFLLESHVLQLQDATTPLRQLYFIIQSMLIDPASSKTTKVSVLALLIAVQAQEEREVVLDGLRQVADFVEDSRPFEALRVLRGLFKHESAPHAVVPTQAVSRVA